LSHSVLDIYLLSLIDRGLYTKYDFQRRGGVSLGSSTPALKRLQNAGFIREQEPEDGSKRIRQILKLTPAGRRVVRKGWRQYFKVELNLDVEAILRVIDIAGHEAVPRGEIIDFVNAMASQRSRSPADTNKGIGEGIVGLQEQLVVYRARAESIFLRDLAKSFTRGLKSATSTNRTRTKVKADR
jgi:DNA-binding PadR family transcriptional regulator